MLSSTSRGFWEKSPVTGGRTGTQIFFSLKGRNPKRFRDPKKVLKRYFLFIFKNLMNNILDLINHAMKSV